MFLNCWRLVMKMILNFYKKVLVCYTQNVRLSSYAPA